MDKPTRLSLTVENLRCIFEDWNDKQRLEVIKSLIWTAPDSHSFLAKVQQLAASRRFTETID